MTDTHITFSVRLPASHHEALRAIAKLRNITTASLTRQFITDAIEANLDLDRIHQASEEKKARLLRTAQEMR